MICIIKRSLTPWFVIYLKKNNCRYIKVRNTFFILKTKENKWIKDVILCKKTIKNACGYENNIIFFSEKNHIYNYEISKILIKVELQSKKTGVSISFNIKYDLMESINEITIKKNGDILFNFNCFHDNIDDEYDDEIKFIKKIYAGVIIMSDEKEKYIMSQLYLKFNAFDLNLKKYEYEIEEKESNLYDISFCHTISNETVLIRKIKTNTLGHIISMGCNNGLVL